MTQIDHEKDIIRTYLSLLDEWIERILQAGVDGKPLPWDKPQLGRVQRIWRSFAEYGVILDHDGLNECVSSFISTIARLEAHTILAGHTSEDPSHYAYIHLEDIELTEEQWETIWALAEEPYTTTWGETYINDGISDYAINPLKELAFALLAADEDDMKEKIVLCDRILNVTHQRGDLASFFIHGGRQTLDMLFEGDTA